MKHAQPSITTTTAAAVATAAIIIAECEKSSGYSMPFLPDLIPMYIRISHTHTSHCDDVLYWVLSVNPIPFNPYLSAIFTCRVCAC